jgi:hypothetical protein
VQRCGYTFIDGTIYAIGDATNPGDGEVIQVPVMA